MPQTNAFRKYNKNQSLEKERQNMIHNNFNTKIYRYEITLPNGYRNFFFLFDCDSGVWKFPGLESNLHHSGDNAGSLTPRPTGSLLLLSVFIW